MTATRRKSKIIHKRSGKSKQLRKYEIAYNKCIKLGINSKICKKSLKRVRPILAKKIIKSVRKSRKRKSISLKSGNKTLNAYQKFVKKESKKSVYKGKNAKSRMRAISKLWKKSKYC